MEQAVRTDITLEKIEKIAFSDLSIPSSFDHNLHALKIMMQQRKQYALDFLATGNEDCLAGIVACNRNICLILAI